MSGDERSRLVRLPAEYQIRLIEEIAANLYDNVPRGLDVDGTPDHGHQLLAQRHQVGRDVGVVLADGSRMNARHEESLQLEQSNRRVPDERDVEVARAGTIGVERCMILPSVTSNRAAAKHRGCSWWNAVHDHATERVVGIGSSAKHESDHVVALLLPGQASLNVRIITHS